MSNIIEQLECAIVFATNFGDCAANHGYCKYASNFEECKYKLLCEALALLKEQQPIEARLHLCESCAKEYPECDATADGIEFGSGVGNDNIIGCTAYVNRWKAQQPRVMTLEEVRLLGKDDIVWYEHKGVFRQPRPRVVEFVFDEHITFTDGGVWSFSADGYGERWRLWASCPSDEQREVTPWK